MKEQLHQHNANDRTVFGFWIYLMTDLIMFAALFAAYAVLHGNIFGGPSSRELFNTQLALSETLILLTSSFTCGLGLLSARLKNKNKTLLFFVITFILGITFLSLEFSHLIADGNGFQKSAFLSSFFTLVGTHGLHISAGLLWMGVLLTKIFRRGITDSMVRKITLFSLFWHFLDIVWIFIFTIVYLMGTM
jgi:cytochrome o ubiquinol oxidase subunit 3